MLIDITLTFKIHWTCIHFVGPIFGAHGTKRFAICSICSYPRPSFCRPGSWSLGRGTPYVSLMPFLMIRGSFLMLCSWYPAAACDIPCSKNQVRFVPTNHRKSVNELCIAVQIEDLFAPMRHQNSVSKIHKNVLSFDSKFGTFQSPSSLPCSRFL